MRDGGCAGVENVDRATVSTIAGSPLRAAGRIDTAVAARASLDAGARGNDQFTCGVGRHATVATAATCALFVEVAGISAFSSDQLHFRGNPQGSLGDERQSSAGAAVFTGGVGVLRAIGSRSAGNRNGRHD